MTPDRPFLFAALLLVAASAHAQGSGFYLGGALGQSKLTEWCDTGGSTTATLPACEAKDTSWKVLGGYRFNQYVAAEATYIDWGEVTATVRSNATGLTVGVAASQISYGLAVVGTLPLGQGFAFFGKAGFLKTEQETTRGGSPASTVDRKETELHYGLGAKYTFTKNWALRGEWEKTEDLKVEMLSIGVEYRF